MAARALTLAVLTAALALATASVHAETFYKWVDENGTVHYGERPPEGVEAERVSVVGGPDVAPGDDPYARPPAAETGPSVAEQRREERAQAREEREQNQERVAAACEAQKARLEQLLPRPKVIMQNPDGTTRMLDDQERLDMIDESQKFVDQYCQDD